MEVKHQYISVFGPSQAHCSKEVYAFGEALGKCLANKGFGIVCGGMGGLMEAVCKGAQSAELSFYGGTIGIIPGEDAKLANPYCDIVIPSGLGIGRNLLVARTGFAAIAVAGGSGTLSEIAFAWQLGKPVCCVQKFGGWSEELADRKLDFRHDTPITPAKNLEDVLSWLDMLT